MSENVIVLLPAAVDLERIFSRLPATLFSDGTPAGIAHGDSAGLRLSSSFKDFIEVYPVPPNDTEYLDERRQGTFEQLGVRDPVMLVFAYRRFESLEQLLEALLPNEDGWLIDQDGIVDRILKGIVTVACLSSGRFTDDGSEDARDAIG